MTKEEYLKRLLELKQYLNDHPSARIVYSDIPVNRLITELKYQILEEMENEENE